MSTEEPLQTTLDDVGADEPSDRERRAEGENVELRHELALLTQRNDTLVEQNDALTVEVADHVLRIGDLELDLKRLQSDVDTLGDAVESNRRIGAAVGILMARLGVQEEAAFAVLKKASQATNTKLAAVAALVVESGEAPSTTPSGGNSRR